MTRIDYLTAKASIMLLYKSRYKKDDFENIKNEIYELNNNHEIISKLETTINTPIVTASANSVPATITPITTTTTPARTARQMSIEYKNTDPSKVFFNPPKLNKIDDFEDIKKWINKMNIPEHSDLIMYPKYKGFKFKIEIGLNSKKMFIIGKYGIPVDISDAFEFTEMSGVAIEVGSYYGQITPQKSIWDEGGLALIAKDVDGFNLYKSPINALYNALLNPTTPANRFIIKHTDCFIDRIANDVFTSSSISEHLDVDDKSLSNLIIPFEITGLDTLSEEFLATAFIEYEETSFIDGFVFEADSVRLQNSLTLSRASVGVELSDLVLEESEFDTVNVTSVTYQLNRFGAVIPVVNFNEFKHYNHRIQRLILDDCGTINEYSIGSDAVVELRIKESEFGDIDVKMTSVLKGSPIFEPISICPRCGKRLEERIHGLYCVNDSCTDLLDKKVSTFFQYLGYSKFTKEIAKNFREAGFKSIMEICLAKYDAVKEACVSLTNSDRDKIYAFLQQLRYSGLEKYKLQFASSCFERISAATLKDLNISSVEDAKDCIVKNVSSDELIKMTKDWIEFIKSNPFILK